MSEEVRTVFTWDTQGVEKGAEKIERSFEKVERAKQNPTSRRGNDVEDGDLRGHARTLRQRSRALQDIEAMEKASHQRRAKLRDDAYAAADRVEQRRVSTVANGIRRVEGAHLGSSGSHGRAAGLLGGNTRLVGDMLDSITGRSGWVMRLRGMEHFLPMIGRAAGPLAAAAAVGGEVWSGAQRNRASDALTEQKRGELSSVLRRSEFSSAGQGVSSLGEQIAQVEEQSKAQAALRAQLREDRNPQYTSWVNRAGFSAWDATKRLAGGRLGQTSSEKLAEGDAQQRILENRENLLRSQRSEAFGHDAAVAQERFSGSAFQSRRMELAFAEKGETAEARKAHASKDDLENIARKFAVENQRVHFEELGERREALMPGREAYIRSRGQDVAQTSAFARFQNADLAFGDAQGDEARMKAGSARAASWQNYVEAARETYRQKDEQHTRMGVAEFRGGAEARTLQAAQAELRIAEKNHDYALQDGEEKARAAKLEVSQKKLALDLTNQQLDGERIGRAETIRAGNIAAHSMMVRVAQNTYSSRDDLRFQAGQAVERDQASSNVARAETALTAANLKAASEREQGGGTSESTAAEQIRAQQELNQAKLEQLETDKKLTFEATHRTRELQTQLVAAKNETAAMRIDNTGRSDRAGVFRSRASTEAQALAYERTGRHDMAEEVQEQQRQREIGLYDEKYLTPSGHHRRRSVINREERRARHTEERRGRANARLERDGGLVDVHRNSRGQLMDGMDPLTHQRVSAEQLYARRHHAEDQAKRERQQETMTLDKFWNALKGYLPKPV